MIVKLLKPTPLVDHVAYAGEFIDGDMLLKRMIASGHAALVDDGCKKTDTVTQPADNSKDDAVTTPADNSEPDKPTVKTSAKKKTAADKE